MTNFDEAYKLIKNYEGGWVNDPNDPGGETYKGISRIYFPDWPGWAIIDNSKINGTPTNISINSKLESLVHDFYKQNFWNRFQGDKINSQAIANELMDCGVNLGVHTAVTYLQHAMNCFGFGLPSMLPLLEDGELGNNTLKALNYEDKPDEISLLVRAQNNQQFTYYMERMLKHPEARKYMGWFSRT